MNLYLTADVLGNQSGGGTVTYHELKALKELGETKCLSRQELIESVMRESITPNLAIEPWIWDNIAVHGFGNSIKLAHIYAGTFTQCVAKLLINGAKVTYTAAAHDVALSKEEHEKLGIPFNYPHLTEDLLWGRYLTGYKQASVLIVPSEHSHNVMRKFGCTNNIKIIPHGVDIPNEPLRPLPTVFTVGYLGAVGPDKGLIYLLQAWKKLNYRDAILVIAGRDSNSEFVQHMVHAFGGGNIILKGWVDKIADFYNSISLYVQPSVTEGFGIEVLEAMAHGRPTICSKGAGASDTVPTSNVFAAADVDALAEMIDSQRQKLPFSCEFWQANAKQYTWDRIESAYQQLWRSLQ